MLSLAGRVILCQRKLAENKGNRRILKFSYNTVCLAAAFAGKVMRWRKLHDDCRFQILERAFSGSKKFESGIRHERVQSVIIKGAIQIARAEVGIRMRRTGNRAGNPLESAWRSHERRWKQNRYAYAVVSRRSRGISVGLNLNPNKRCNFDCVYCQVNRGLPPAARNVNLSALAGELDRILQAENDGSLYEDPPFNVLDPAERGVRDIAFSGDGEPTTYRRFEEAIRIAADARLRFGLHSAKLVLLTNAACLDTPSVRRALALLDENKGEIWAKLDAGTETYFRTVNRAHVPLDRILENILGAARLRPLVIQTLWSRIYDAAPPDDEIEAYCGRLKGLLAAGGRIKNIQLHTVAREPAEDYVSPLSSEELARIASIVTSRIPAVSGILEIFDAVAPGRRR